MLRSTPDRCSRGTTPGHCCVSKTPSVAVPENNLSLCHYAWKDLSRGRWVRKHSRSLVSGEARIYIYYIYYIYATMSLALACICLDLHRGWMKMPAKLARACMQLACACLLACKCMQAYLLLRSISSSLYDCSRRLSLFVKLCSLLWTLVHRQRREKTGNTPYLQSSKQYNARCH